MNISGKIFLLLGVAFVIGLSSYFAGWISPKMSDHVIDSREVKSAEFTIRATAFSETNSLVPGAYYVFEATDHRGTSREILNFRNDDPADIRHDSIAFVDEKTAYIFFGWMYAVTLDSGKTWSIWDGSRELPEWKCCNYSLIKGVTLNRDGQGEMRLSAADGEVAGKLKTEDFGQTWAAADQENLR